MTTEEITNEYYPYRLPVFVLDNSEGYSQVVLNNILVDNARNNVTYNNNAIMFLRKKQFVPGINVNKEIYSDLSKVSPGTCNNKKETTTSLTNETDTITA